MDCNELTIKTTIKVTSSNKDEIEEIVHRLILIGGIDELTANMILCSAALL